MLGDMMYAYTDVCTTTHYDICMCVCVCLEEAEEASGAQETHTVSHTNTECHTLVSRGGGREEEEEEEILRHILANIFLAGRRRRRAKYSLECVKRGRGWGGESVKEKCLTDAVNYLTLLVITRF